MRNKEREAEYKKKYNAENKEKIAEYKRAYYQVYNKLHKERLAQKAKEYAANNKERLYTTHIKRKYGLSKEEYDAMIEVQDNSCACCGEPFIRTPHVDHCHTTGVVRGLLCTGCNSGLGFYEKKHKLFKQYLENTFTVEELEP